MAERGEQGAYPTLGEVSCHLASGSSFYYLLRPFHWPIACMNHSCSGSLGAGDGFGGHMTCTGLAEALRPSTQTKRVRVTTSSNLSDSFR